MRIYWTTESMLQRKERELESDLCFSLICTVTLLSTTEYNGSLSSPQIHREKENRSSISCFTVLCNESLNGLAQKSQRCPRTIVI